VTTKRGFSLPGSHSALPTTRRERLHVSRVAYVKSFEDPLRLAALFVAPLGLSLVGPVAGRESAPTRLRQGVARVEDPALERAA
jgi:hypothetical protein